MGLSGIWYNQLGSQMELKIAKGQISGTYISAVGVAKGQKYNLVGLTDTDEDPGQRNIGFVVSWENDNGSLDCVTTWSGEVQEHDGAERIVTTWLLTVEWSPGQQWKSTLVGQDIFTRHKPTPAPRSSSSSEPIHDMRPKKEKASDK